MTRARACSLTALALAVMSATASPDDFILTEIKPPGATGALAYGINNAGQIVGSFDNRTGPTHGFLYSGGNFTQIDVPGSLFTDVYGINNAGQIVGSFDGR